MQLQIGIETNCEFMLCVFQHSFALSWWAGLVFQVKLFSWKWIFIFASSTTKTTRQKLIRKISPNLMVGFTDEFIIRASRCRNISLDICTWDFEKYLSLHHIKRLRFCWWCVNRKGVGVKMKQVVYLPVSDNSNINISITNYLHHHIHPRKCNQFWISNCNQ